MRVAIAEDSVLLREGLARLLGDSGFEVVAQCSTASELLLKVRSFPPDKRNLATALWAMTLVIAPILEQSLRQSLIMSNGNYLIFFSRPISLSLMIFSIGLLVLAAYSFILKRADWRTKLAEGEAGETET